MNVINTARKIDLSTYRILAIAIAISLIWHLFWLSVIKVVSSPVSKTPVKFSRVAFLGPILVGSGMEVSASPRLKSLLERRYCDIANRMLGHDDELTKASGLKDEVGGLPSSIDKKISCLIDDSIADEKLEPDFLAY